MSKLIPLTRRQFAIVDDADFDWLSQFKWCALPATSNGFYAVRRASSSGGLIYMHRFILGIESGDADHINRNKLDNRRLNLRAATRPQNMSNRLKLNRNGRASSQFKGVSLNKQLNKWHATISQKHIGYFTSELEAARAYDAAALLHFGEFARLNFPEGTDMP